MCGFVVLAEVSAPKGKGVERSHGRCDAVQHGRVEGVDVVTDAKFGKNVISGVFESDAKPCDMDNGAVGFGAEFAITDKMVTKGSCV